MLISLFLATMLAQTKMPTSQIRPVAGTPPASLFIVDSTGSIRFAKLGTGLKIDCNAEGCVISSPIVVPTFVLRTVERQVLATTLNEYTLSRVPVEVDLSRNGLLLTDGIDYDVVGAKIVMKQNESFQVGDVFRISWK